MQIEHDRAVDSAGDRAVALEIGMAFLSAQRAAAAIVEDARRQAVALTQPDDDRPRPPQAEDDDLRALGLQVDEIERVLTDRQTRLSDLIDEISERPLPELAHELTDALQLGDGAPSQGRMSPPETVIHPLDGTSSIHPVDAISVADVEQMDGGLGAAVRTESPTEPMPYLSFPPTTPGTIVELGTEVGSSAGGDSVPSVEAAISPEVHSERASSSNNPWLVNLIAAGVVVVVLALALLLVNTL